MDDGIDEPGCMCGQPECPECGRYCHTCGGDGWGIDGEDWELDDPVNDDPGEIVRCMMVCSSVRSSRTVSRMMMSWIALVLRATSTSSDSASGVTSTMMPS